MRRPPGWPAKQGWRRASTHQSPSVMGWKLPIRWRPGLSTTQETGPVTNGFRLAGSISGGTGGHEPQQSRMTSFMVPTNAGWVCSGRTTQQRSPKRCPAAGRSRRCGTDNCGAAVHRRTTYVMLLALVVPLQRQTCKPVAHTPRQRGCNERAGATHPYTVPRCSGRSPSSRPAAASGGRVRERVKATPRTARASFKKARGGRRTLTSFLAVHAGDHGRKMVE